MRFAAKGQCPFHLVGEAEANSIFWKNQFLVLLIEAKVLPIDYLGRLNYRSCAAIGRPRLKDTPQLEKVRSFITHGTGVSNVRYAIIDSRRGVYGF